MSLYNITTKEEFDERVLLSTKPVLVDFWATWCPPCRAMAPILEAIVNETEYDVVKIDIEASEFNKQTAIQYGVQGIPNMKVFKDGKAVQELIGMKPKQVLIDALSSASSAE